MDSNPISYYNPIITSNQNPASTHVYHYHNSDGLVEDAEHYLFQLQAIALIG
jgi:hypothetical protein